MIKVGSQFEAHRDKHQVILRSNLALATVDESTKHHYRHLLRVISDADIYYFYSNGAEKKAAAARQLSAILHEEMIRQGKDASPYALSESDKKDLVAVFEKHYGSDDFNQIIADNPYVFSQFNIDDIIAFQNSDIKPDDFTVEGWKTITRMPFGLRQTLDGSVIDGLADRASTLKNFTYEDWLTFGNEHKDAHQRHWANDYTEADLQEILTSKDKMREMLPKLRDDLGLSDAQIIEIEEAYLNAPLGTGDYSTKSLNELSSTLLQDDKRAFLCMMERALDPNILKKKQEITDKDKTASGEEIADEYRITDQEWQMLFDLRGFECFGASDTDWDQYLTGAPSAVRMSLLEDYYYKYKDPSYALIAEEERKRLLAASIKEFADVQDTFEKDSVFFLTELDRDDPSGRDYLGEYRGPHYKEKIQLDHLSIYATFDKHIWAPDASGEKAERLQQGLEKYQKASDGYKKLIGEFKGLGQDLDALDAATKNRLDRMVLGNVVMSAMYYNLWVKRTGKTPPQPALSQANLQSMSPYKFVIKDNQLVFLKDKTGQFIMNNKFVGYEAVADKMAECVQVLGQSTPDSMVDQDGNFTLSDAAINALATDKFVGERAVPSVEKAKLVITNGQKRLPTAADFYAHNKMTQERSDGHLRKHITMLVSGEAYRGDEAYEVAYHNLDIHRQHDSRASVSGTPFSLPRECYTWSEEDGGHIKAGGILVSGHYAAAYLDYFGFKREGVDQNGNANLVLDANNPAGAYHGFLEDMDASKECFNEAVFVRKVGKKWEEVPTDEVDKTATDQYLAGYRFKVNTMDQLTEAQRLYLTDVGKPLGMSPATILGAMHNKKYLKIDEKTGRFIPNKQNAKLQEISLKLHQLGQVSHVLECLRMLDDGNADSQETYLGEGNNGGRRDFGNFLYRMMNDDEAMKPHIQTIHDHIALKAGYGYPPTVAEQGFLEVYETDRNYYRENTELTLGIPLNDKAKFMPFGRAKQLLNGEIKPGADNMDVTPIGEDKTVAVMSALNGMSSSRS